MSHYTLRKPAPLTALLALAVLGGSAAHAQTSLNPNGTAAQLGAGAVTTAPYAAGTPSGVGTINTLPSPYHVTAGGQTITFTATNGSVFESRTNQGQYDFAAGTQILDTFDPISKNPTGPLQIDFSSSVQSFGLQAQSARFDSERFTVDLYKTGADIVPFYSYVTPIFDNTIGSGKSVFLGVQSTDSNAFTKVIISSQSFTAAPVTGNNDFYFGPLGFQPAAVPEASSVVSLGMALTLLGGVTLIARRRRVTRA